MPPSASAASGRAAATVTASSELSPSNLIAPSRDQREDRISPRAVRRLSPRNACAEPRTEKGSRTTPHRVLRTFARGPHHPRSRHKIYQLTQWRLMAQLEILMIAPTAEKTDISKCVPGW